MNKEPDIFDYLETTSLEPHDDYTSEFTYKEQKIIWNRLKEQQQELERYKNIIDELEKILNYDINKSTEYMNRFIGEEQGNYPVHYYRAEWQKEKAIGYLDKLKELKGSDN